MSELTLTREALEAPSLVRLLRSLSDDPAFSQCQEFERRVDEAIVRAFHNDEVVAELEIHRFLYEVDTHRILPPWSPDWRDYEHPVVLAAHRRAGEAWLAHERLALGSQLAVPTTPEAFAAWARDVCMGHPSGVGHPLFDFLAERATFQELRGFVLQETPFDIHFGDLIAMLLPGIHGEVKIELAGNFWDEMGRGVGDVTHRRLRFAMMQRVGIPLDIQLSGIDCFWLEELRLANLYFQAVNSRRLAPQAIGMLLATELVVPGRISRQIDGWRRVGLIDHEMRYLLEHVTVDVAHAEGWLKQVLHPIAVDRPDLLPEVALGVVRRLDAAMGVCERAWSEYQPERRNA